jgi:hypothetical protein
MLVTEALFPPISVQHRARGSMSSISIGLQASKRLGVTVPRAIHVLNLSALVALSAILLPAAVVRFYQLAILVPIFSLLFILYWLLRRKLTVVACGLGFAVSLGLWIVVCENVVHIDNVFGTRITRNLSLSPRLMSYAARTLRARAAIYQECCNDPLTYHYKPNSTYRNTYDCDTCNDPYEVIVDETGYLNRQLGLVKSNETIDLFLAGDSVMQGIGMPSVLDQVKNRIPLKMWNLAMAGYGPRQKITSLIAYALPKHPKWLMVDFYSGNDVTDAIEFELCDGVGDFRCVVNKELLRRRLLAHPLYGPLLSESPDRLAVFDEYVENSLTLAVTRYFADRIKSALKYRLVGGRYESPARGTDGRQLPEPNPIGVSLPASVSHHIRPGRLLAWAEAGMRETHRHYRRLVAELAELESRPSVILLYNPSGYEIYRDIMLDRNPKYDEISAFQMAAQRAFAQKHGWTFVDLTVPLRDQLNKTKAWIYGEYDGTHWSHQGTAVVADVLTAEIMGAIAK